MITIQNFIESVDYKITGGGAHGWNCFGSNARWLDCEDRDYSAAIVFDSINQTVYVAELCDFVNQRAYRWVNPEFKTAYMDEAKARNVSQDQAWDDVSYYDLDIEEDWLEKAKAISNKNFNYDTRVMINVEFDDSDLLKYMKLAHERDITFNQLIEEAIKEAIQLHKISE